MNQVTTLEFSMASCWKEAKQTNLSLVLRIAGVALGVLAFAGAALLLRFRYDLRLVVACAAVGAMTTALSIFMRQIYINGSEAGNEVIQTGKSELIKEKKYELKAIDARSISVAYPLDNGNMLLVQTNNDFSTEIILYDSSSNKVSSLPIDGFMGCEVKDDSIYLRQDKGGIIELRINAENYDLHVLRQNSDWMELISTLAAYPAHVVVAATSKGQVWIKQDGMIEKEYQFEPTSTYYPDFKFLHFSEDKIFYQKGSRSDVYIFNTLTSETQEIPIKGNYLDGLVIVKDKVVLLHHLQSGSVYQLDIYQKDFETPTQSKDLFSMPIKHLLSFDDKIIVVTEMKVTVLDEEGDVLKEDFCKVLESNNRYSQSLVKAEIKEGYLITLHEEESKQCTTSTLSVWNLNNFELEFQTALKENIYSCLTREGFVATHQGDHVKVVKFDPKNFFGN